MPEYIPDPKPKDWGYCDYTACGPYGGIDCNSNRFCRKKRWSARIWLFFFWVVLTIFFPIIVGFLC